MDIRRENLVIPYKYYSNFPDKLNLITNVIMTVTSLVRVGSHSIRSGLFAPPVLFYVGGALAAGDDGDPVGKRRGGGDGGWLSMPHPLGRTIRFIGSLCVSAGMRIGICCETH